MVRIPLSQARPQAWLLLIALASFAVTLLSGMASALTYTNLETAVRAVGLTLQHLRGVHEAAAFGWMFLGGSALVYFYLFSTYGSPSADVRRRLIAHSLLWVTAGAGIVLTLLTGRFTGREYAPYHPAFSAMILAGWFLFAWNFFSLTRGRLRGQPTYIYMWSVSLILFVITYTEAHLYLFDWVSDQPIRDLQIQWRSNGTMVGAFNQMLYGTLLYVGCRIAGDEQYPHSRLAWALFSVGVINTFTYYGHHTVYLPQSAWVHWIAFVISMAEIVIFAKLCVDLVLMVRRPRKSDGLRVSDLFLRSTTVWTFLLLGMALVISIPPFNALIHGTHVVVGHSMVSMIGIDSMIIFVGFSFVVYTLLGDKHPVVTGSAVRRVIPGINILLAVLWLSFVVHGLAVGWSRYAGPTALDLSLVFKWFPVVMAVSGVLLGFALLDLVRFWARALVPVLRLEPQEAVASLAVADATVDRGSLN